MKKKGIFIAIYILLLLTALGFLGYQIFVLKDTSDLVKPALVIIALFASLVKVVTGKGRRRRPSVAALKRDYADLISGAFTEEPAMEKKFYSALQDFNMDRYSSALKKLDALRLSASRSADRFAIELFTALCFDEQAQYEQAIRHYNAALQFKESSTAASNLGLCYSRIGNDRYAIDAYKRSVRADQSNPFPLNNLAQLHIRTGEYEEAQRYARQALEHNSRMVQALSAMAIACAMLGDQDGYEKYYRQAVSKGYDGSKIKNYIQALKSSR